MTTNELHEMAVELVGMAAEDNHVREKLAHDGELYEVGYHPVMREVHDRNAFRLAQILDEHGWPGRSKVGDNAARAAWLILQHAISHPDLQRYGLELLKSAPAGEVAPLEIAMLDDRIRTYEGRGQLYGTQFDWDENGEMSPKDIEDAEAVDDRRKALGLRPIAEETKLRRAAVARSGERPPRDWAARHQRMERWMFEVGWRKPQPPDEKEEGGRRK